MGQVAQLGDSSLKKEIPNLIMTITGPDWTSTIVWERKVEEFAGLMFASMEYTVKSAGHEVSWVTHRKTNIEWVLSLFKSRGFDVKIIADR